MFQGVEALVRVLHQEPTSGICLNYACELEVIYARTLSLLGPHVNQTQMMRSSRLNTARVFNTITGVL